MLTKDDITAMIEIGCGEMSVSVEDQMVTHQTVTTEKLTRIHSAYEELVQIWDGQIGMATDRATVKQIVVQGKRTGLRSPWIVTGMMAIANCGQEFQDSAPMF